jgi:hypothetical protein
MTLAEDYSTHDLNLAAFLLARGHPLQAVGREPGGRCVFRFPIRAREDAPGFLAKVAVPAWDYANALRSLKARVRESY